jgi:putative Ca2+/H+ antiporter (TMEM165/GDT1 family)
LVDFTLASFGAMAAALFVTELTDKDSLLLIAVSTRVRARVTFAAGATAFIMTTTIIVTLGSLLVSVVPVVWVRIAGGVVMLAYGIWEARGIVGQGAVQGEESRVAKAGSTWKVFGSLVLALAVLDLAGDATEILTVVFVSEYRNLLFVFSGVCTGLLAATAVEATLGSRLGKLFTPRRLRIGSAAIFLILGASIVLYSTM